LLVVTHLADATSFLIATHASIFAIAGRSARVTLAGSISRFAALLCLPGRRFCAAAHVLILGKTVADGTSQQNCGGCDRKAKLLHKGLRVSEFPAPPDWRSLSAKHRVQSLVPIEHAMTVRAIVMRVTIGAELVTANT
jgi:hypothetical protein